MVIVYLVSALLGAATAAAIMSVGFGSVGVAGFVGAVYAGAMTGVAAGVLVAWSRRTRAPVAFGSRAIPSGVVWC